MKRIKLRVLRFLFPNWIWTNADPSAVAISLDDGPHPVATPIALKVLRKYEVKAVFFCLGSNVEKHPELFQDILNEGHIIGNHTYNHENGWRTKPKEYFDSIDRCTALVNSNLFRPPYGKLPAFYSRSILNRGHKIILWSWLSYDFDSSMTPKKMERRLASISPGDLLVFHDNGKTAHCIGDYLEMTLAHLLKRSIPIIPLKTP